jgi:CBS domain-containing protein
MKTLKLPDSHQLPTDFALLCVGDVMQRDLITVHAEDSLHEVEQVLADAGISGVPVVGDDEEVIGVLSMSDLIGRYAENAEDESPFADVDPEMDDDEDSTETLAFRRPADGSLCAGDMMNPHVSRIAATASLREAARAMVEQNIHRLLVTERGRVVGLVSTLDLLRALAG